VPVKSTAIPFNEKFEKIMAIWAIGDIHGHSKHLKQLLGYLPLAPGDTIVFLGDVIDRGRNGVSPRIHK